MQQTSKATYSWPLNTLRTGRYVRYCEGRDKEKMQGMSMGGFDLWIERLVAWVQPRSHCEYLAHSKAQTQHLNHEPQTAWNALPINTL